MSRRGVKVKTMTHEQLLAEAMSSIFHEDTGMPVHPDWDLAIKAEASILLDSTARNIIRRTKLTPVLTPIAAALMCKALIKLATTMMREIATTSSSEKLNGFASGLAKNP